MNKTHQRPEQEKSIIMGKKVILRNIDWHSKMTIYLIHLYVPLKYFGLNDDWGKKNIHNLKYNDENLNCRIFLYLYQTREIMFQNKLWFLVVVLNFFDVGNRIRRTV